MPLPSDHVDAPPSAPASVPCPASPSEGNQMTTYHVDAAQVSSATQSVQGTIGRIQAEVASLLGQLTGLQSSWTGQAASAFQGAVADWRATQLQVEQSLANLNRALGLAATQYVEAEQANARLFLR